MPSGHQCGRLHGHNYTVELVLACEDLDPTGFVLDYGQLQPFKAFIDSVLDHHHINDQVMFNPTAENLAVHLYQVATAMFPHVVAVRVYETPKTSAEYRP